MLKINQIPVFLLFFSFSVKSTPLEPMDVDDPLMETQNHSQVTPMEIDPHAPPMDADPEATLEVHIRIDPNLLISLYRAIQEFEQFIQQTRQFIQRMQQFTREREFTVDPYRSTDNIPYFEL